MGEQKYARFTNLLEENLDMINALAQMWDADLETVITEIFETGIHVHAYVLEMMADEELENLTDKDGEDE